MNGFQRSMQNRTFVSEHILEGTLSLKLQKNYLWISDFWCNILEKVHFH